MRGMHKNPDRFIDGVVAHMQVFFCDPSLGTQIKIKVSSSLVIFYGVSDFIIFQTTGKNTYHKGKKLHALDENFELKALQNWIRKTAYQNANLWVVFSNTNKDGVMGKAFIGRGDSAKEKVPGLRGVPFFRVDFYCIFGRFGKMTHLVNFKKCRGSSPGCPGWCGAPVYWNSLQGSTRKFSTADIIFRICKG